jgi:hypothetical protein
MPEVCDMASLLIGFVLGIVASGLAWLLSEKWVQPKPEVKLDAQRFMGQSGRNPPHEFFHVVIRNAAARWPLKIRRPAWACEARITIVEPIDALGASPTIIARWTSQPEPVTPTDGGLALDPGKMILARRMDVFSHHAERVAVVLKYEGDSDYYLFSNESYLFEGGKNPKWRLPEGRYRLRISVSHENGESVTDLRLENSGRSRNEVKIALWS